MVERTHRCLVASGTGRRQNHRFQEPSEFVGLSVEPDPVELTRPLVQCDDPTPAQAREALERATRDSLDAATLGDLIFGVSEAVTNARVHGRAPSTVRIWLASGRAVVQIRDSGPGPADHPRRPHPHEIP